MVTNFDKGSATVILTQEEYKRKVITFLSDNGVAPLLLFSFSIAKIVLLNICHPHIKDNKLYVTQLSVPKHYGLIKCHKHGLPIPFVTAHYTS